MKKQILRLLLPACLIVSACEKKLVEQESKGLDARSSSTLMLSENYSDFSEFDYKGVNWSPYGDYWRGPTVADDAADIKNAGADWVRVWLRSDTSLVSLDSLVSKCKSTGAKILAVYKKSNPRTDLGNLSDQAADTALLRSIVNRYKSSIHYWEIHNEPNLDGYWNLGSDTNTTTGSTYSNGVKNYVSWLRLAYITISCRSHCNRYPRRHIILQDGTIHVPAYTGTCL